MKNSFAAIVFFLNLMCLVLMTLRFGLSCVRDGDTFHGWLSALALTAAATLNGPCAVKLFKYLKE